MKSVFKREPRGREKQKSGPKEAPPAPGSEKFAPLDGGIRASEERGANPGPFRRHRAGKSLLPWTEE